MTSTRTTLAPLTSMKNDIPEVSDATSSEPDGRAFVSKRTHSALDTESTPLMDTLSSFIEKFISQVTYRSLLGLTPEEKLMQVANTFSQFGILFINLFDESFDSFTTLRR
ncbi:hypothetical protein ACS0TY_010711 [Phlomoides rotata]